MKGMAVGERAHAPLGEWGGRELVHRAVHKFSQVQPTLVAVEQEIESKGETQKRVAEGGVKRGCGRSGNVLGTFGIHGCQCSVMRD